ncbi:MAG: restriction endonuclease subunit S [Longibaculum sp.]
MKTFRFENFIELKRGFDLPDSKVIEGDYPVVAASSIKTYHNEFKVYSPIVTTGRSGTLGKVLYVEENGWPLNTTLYVKDFKNNNPLYVYYYLKLMHLEQFNSGVGVPTLNRNHLNSIKVKIHELDKQKSLVDIVNKYDLLIENNNKRIKTLKQMAEELYKEWFVRFRYPNNDETLKKSDLGDIPETFEIKKIGDVINYYIGGGWGNDESSANFPIDAYVIRGADFPKVIKGDISSTPKRFHKNSNYKTRKLVVGDIVFEISGGTQEQPVGRSVLITKGLLEQYNNSVICASFCKLVRVNSDLISPVYFWYWLQYMYDTRMIERFQLQSTGIINFKFEYFLRKGLILIPPIELIEKFENYVMNLRKEIDYLAIANANLIKQRDLLLPRLMSGKLEVK